MDKPQPSFPFYRLRHHKYIVLEVLKSVEYYIAHKFMHGITKSARLFLLKNYKAHNNELQNEGLYKNGINFYSTEGL